MSEQTGRWHGRKRFFGLHYDLHANAKDTDLGKGATVANLLPMLRLSGADFVQTDCKGHPGMTSWFSRVPNATVSPGVVRDALKGWRAATRKLGLPLHCHYSGIWDQAAGAAHRSWCVIDKDGRRSPDKMCPRGPYLDELMIPQMFELIDRYGVNGFWVDGELWAAEPCYCRRCLAAYRAESGKKPPVSPDAPDWADWMAFTRRSLDAYVARYCDAVHSHKPGVLVCSNWLQTFKDPGRPQAPTDWISGDNNPVFGLDYSRREARFLSTRRKPWDIMLWSFYRTENIVDQLGAWSWTPKPPQMVMQEAAVLLAFGGNVQIYENPPGLRDGRLVPWRVKRIAQAGAFIKARRALCQDSQTIPQIAVLHSERHLWANIHGPNLMNDTDVTSVSGAVYGLLEHHYGVDVLDEWALLPRLADFPVVVVPEQDKMSRDAVLALREYVRKGGKLLVSGAASFQRFGAAFLGVKSAKVVDDATYNVPASDGAVEMVSKRWRLLRATTAEVFGRLGTSPLLNQRLLPHPAFTVNRVGKGAVAYIPFDVFHFFDLHRYPLAKAFIGDVVRRLGARFPIRVAAPTCVDVTLRRKPGRIIIHLVNRASGIPSRPNDGTVDEIPRMGPVIVDVDLPVAPRRVSTAWERSPMRYAFKRAGRKGTLTVKLDYVHIHTAIVADIGTERTN